MDALPNRAAVDLQPALGQLRDQAAQREIPRVASLDQPISMRTKKPSRLVSGHLAGRSTAGTAKALQPPIAHYIDGFHNTIRRHSALDFMSPVQFERLAAS